MMRPLDWLRRTLLQIKLDRVPLIVMWASLLPLLWGLWRYLEILQIDISGHIASARSFGEGYFHRFQDHFFLGYVHGLFLSTA